MWSVPVAGSSDAACDFADRQQQHVLVDWLDDQGHRIDILVNNAGIIRRAPAIDHTDADWDAVLEVNLTAPFVLTRALAEPMIARGRGKVVFVTSILGFQGGVTVPGYAATKSAIIGLTKALANEWAGLGVNVNAIAPGYVRTDNTQALQDDPERSEAIRARIPAGDWGSPDQIAGAAVYLAVTGSRLRARQRDHGRRRLDGSLRPTAAGRVVRKRHGSRNASTDADRRTTVDGEDDSRHEPGLLRGQEECGVRGVPRRSHSAEERHLAVPLLTHRLDRDPSRRGDATDGHRRVDETQRDRVASDTTRCIRLGDRGRQSIHARFRDLVGHLEAPGVRGRRRHVDDRTASAFTHRGQRGPAHPPHRREVHVDDPFEGLRGRGSGRGRRRLLMPTTLTSTSRRPQRSSEWATMAAHCSCSSVTSAPKAMAT